MTDSSKTYFVIGDPISHSLSPPLHEYLFSKLSMPFKYESLRVTSNELPDFLKRVTETDIPGFNVTIPHKERIIPFLDGLISQANRIGAVNTVKNYDGILIGYNTDVYGCRYALERSIPYPLKKGVIIGAGGGARAAAEALSLMGLRGIVILNRNVERARALKEHFRDYPDLTIEFGRLDEETLKTHLKDADIIVNATPIGMWPEVDRSNIPAPEFIPPQCTVFDMVPNPATTKFLNQAMSRGARIISGIDMLIAQAIESQKIWLDQEHCETCFEDVRNYMLKIVENFGD